MVTPKKMAKALDKALKTQAARLVYQTIAPNRFTLWLPGREYRRLSPLLPRLEDELCQQAEKTAKKLGMLILPGGMDLRITPYPAPKGRGLRIQARFARENAARARLVALEGLSRGLVYPLTRPRTIIGRGGADICLPPEVKGVSRKHARLQAGRGGFVLEDMGSATGTFVNELPVESKPLDSGDLIFIGSVVFGYRAGTPQGGAHA